MDKLFTTKADHLSKTLLIFTFLLSMVGVFAQETFSIDAKVTYFGVCAPNLIMIDSAPVNMVTLLHSSPR